MLGFTHYAVYWLSNIVQLGEKKGVSLSLGVCERTKRIAFIVSSNWLKIFLINDVVTDKKVCEDGRWCLCLDCEYNRATWRSAKAEISWLRNEKEFRFLIKTLKDIEAKVKKYIDDIEWGKVHFSYFSEPPCVLKLVRKSA